MTWLQLVEVEPVEYDLYLFMYLLFIVLLVCERLCVWH